MRDGEIPLMSNHDIPTWTLRPAHDWLRPLRVAFDLTSPTRVVAQAASGLRAAFERLGHRVDLAPEPETEVVIANAGFGQPISWRRAPLFMAGRRYRMARTPTVVTLISASVREVEDLLERIAGSETIDSLVHHMLAVWARHRRPDTAHLTALRVEVKRQIGLLRRLLRSRSRLSFNEEFGEAEPLVQAVTVLAILNLVAKGEADVSQHQPFGDIEIMAREVTTGV